MFDFCIVGSAPAGIALALKLARSNKRVVLLEDGETEPSARSRDLYGGFTTGDPYFPIDLTRLRFLGGTSNHWTGMCRPLDDIDFEIKPYCPSANWPITKADLDPYVAETKAILKIEALPADRQLGPLIKEIGFNFAPLRFARAYGEILRRSPNLHVFLNANVTSFQTNGNATTGAEITTWSGRKLRKRSANDVWAHGNSTVVGR